MVGFGYGPRFYENKEKTPGPGQYTPNAGDRGPAAKMGSLDGKRDKDYGTAGNESSPRLVKRSTSVHHDRTSRKCLLSELERSKSLQVSQSPYQRRNPATPTTKPPEVETPSRIPRPRAASLKIEINGACQRQQQPLEKGLIDILRNSPVAGKGLVELRSAVKALSSRPSFRASPGSSEDGESQLSPQSSQCASCGSTGVDVGVQTDIEHDDLEETVSPFTIEATHSPASHTAAKSMQDHGMNERGPIPANAAAMASVCTESQNTASSLQQDLAMLQSRFEYLEAERDSAQQQLLLATTLSLLQAKDAMLAEQQNSCNSLRSHLSAQSALLSDALRQAESLQAELDGKQLVSVNFRIVSQEEAEPCTSCAATGSKLQELLDTHTAQFADQDRQLSKLQAELQHTLNDLLEKESMLSALQQQYQLSQSLFSEKEATLAKTDNQHASLLQELQHSRSACKAVEAKLADQDEQQSLLQQRLQHSQTLLSEKDHRLAAHNRELSLLQQQLQHSQRALSEKDAELADQLAALQNCQLRLGEQQLVVMAVQVCSHDAPAPAAPLATPHLMLQQETPDLAVLDQQPGTNAQQSPKFQLPVADEVAPVAGGMPQATAVAVTAATERFDPGTPACTPPVTSCGQPSTAPIAALHGSHCAQEDQLAAYQIKVAELEALVCCLKLRLGESEVEGNAEDEVVQRNWRDDYPDWLKALMIEIKKNALFLARKELCA